MKNYDKSKEPSYLKYWGVDNLIGCIMSQKLPSGSFWRVEETSQYNEDSIKIYNGESEVGYDSWIWCSLSRGIKWIS